MLCMVWCKRHSLETAIAIIDASADFFVATKRLVLVSVMYFVISVIFVIVWLVALLCVASFAEIVAPAEKGSQMRSIAPIGTKEKVFIALLVFGVFWVLNFISHKTKYITMVSASTYYFDSNEQGDGSASVLTGFRFAYMKNIGSLCYGSLILTIIGILRAIVDGLAENAKEDGDGAAKLVACLA